MAAFSFARPFLRARRARELAPRPPIRAVMDLGAPWSAPVVRPEEPISPLPPERPAPRQESIVELLRRLEQGLAERAERTPAEPEPTPPADDMTSALRDALDTLQRMARQER